jgi:SAM-dependent methyltransferase
LSRGTEQADDPGCERIDITEDGPADETEYEHRARYEWALSMVTGPVLDIACGTGHGSALLAERFEVTGVDKDPGAVERARSRTKATFLQADVPPLPFEDNRFATVVSFETIEHIDDDSGFVKELRRVLQPGGSLIVSTPNRLVCSPNTPPDTAPPNRFHVREYALDEIQGLLRDEAGFEEIDVFAQQYVPPRTLKREIALNLRLRLHVGRAGGPISRAAFGDLEVQRWRDSREPMFWILVAR